MEGFDYLIIGFIFFFILVGCLIAQEQSELDLNEEVKCLEFKNRDLGDVPIRCIKYFDLQNIEIVK